MRKKYILTIDLGASSGRGIVFEYGKNGPRPVSEHRFANRIVTLGGTDYWDFLHLFWNVKQAVRKAAGEYPVSSMGIDTWGLDFGLVDQTGALMENPVSYRDKRTRGISAKLHEIVSRRELYRATGTQYLPGNTVYQLYYLLCEKPELMERASGILMMPDLITYYLTGEKHAEFTEASTTQLVDMRRREWSAALLERIGLPRPKLADIVFAGKQAFSLRADVREELGAGDIPVVTVASHDSASAVAAVPFRDAEKLYISSGTWSILGLEREAPIIDEASYRHEISNEGGYGNTVCCSRNLMGLWLVQECARQWEAQGTRLSYADLDEAARLEKPLAAVFDPEDETLQNRCDMPAAIAKLCEKNGRKAPQTPGQYARSIYESMALNYRRALDVLRKQTNLEFRSIHVVGGGAKARFLNACIADATGLSVIAGPAEATAYGNAFAQMHWAGDVSSLREFRDMIGARQGETARYEPGDRDGWDDAYAAFCGG